MIGICPACGKIKLSIKTVRQNTAYVDDFKNYFRGCEDCREQNDEYWAEMWNDYYGMVSAGIQAGNLAKK